jgi:hypothetical protein
VIGILVLGGPVAMFNPPERSLLVDYISNLDVRVAVFYTTVMHTTKRYGKSTSLSLGNGKVVLSYPVLASGD